MCKSSSDVIKAMHLLGLVKLCSKQICRVFLALTEDPKDRGTIVAHGGGKVSHAHMR